MTKRLFLKSDLEKIESHIKSFEKSTSSQLVVVTALKSDPYTSVPLRFGILGILIFSLTYLLLSRTLFWLPLPYLFCFQTIGFFAFSLFGKSRLAVAYFVPDWILAERVREAALAAFVEKGVHETLNNTGILIYLSEKERRVEILADTLAFKALNLEGLQAQAQAIIAGIKAKRPTEALCKAIDDLATQLKKHFPNVLSNKNELSDEVRVE